MKHCPVVPEIVPCGWLEFQDVAGNPCYALRLVAQALLRPLQRPFRNVEHSNVRVSFLQQTIDEPAVPAASVDDLCGVRKIEAADEFKRRLRIFLPPAYLVGLFCVVDVLPVVRRGLHHSIALAQLESNVGRVYTTTNNFFS